MRDTSRGVNPPGLTRVGIWWTLVALVPLAFLAIFFVWPVATLIGRGLFADGRLTLEGFAGVFGSPRTWRVVGTSLSLAVWARRCRWCSASPGVRPVPHPLPRTRGTAGVHDHPFVMPTVVAGVAMQALLGEGGPLGFLGLGESFAGIVLALVWFNYRS